MCKCAQVTHISMQNTAPETIAIAGKQLETLIINSPLRDGETIVMLHPGLGSIGSWHRFPQKLAEATGCSILLYSRYGYGYSEPLKEKRDKLYLHHEGEIVLPELLARFNIRQPVLFGHSDGATIALLYAAKYPDRVRAVILEAPHVFVEEITIAGLIEAKKAFSEGKGELAHRLKPYHIDSHSTFCGWNDIWLDPAFRNWNIEQELPAIGCPMLVIQGEDDQYGTLAQLETIKRLTANTELYVIPDCRHSPHSDQGQAVLAKSKEFLERHMHERSEA
jgi:pimeloyl-ACP methyl ester carboxylesterase